MSRRRSTSALFTVAGVALALVASACGSSGGSSPAASSSTSSSASSLPAMCGGKSGSGKVVVGAARFGENETLAQIYAAALTACGYSPTTKYFTSREVYYPALKKGDIQVVPEYAATLTDYINTLANGPNAASKASGNIDTTMTALRSELPSSLKALNPATATDKNAFAVTKASASSHNLTTMSQLGTYSQSHPVKLAGPPECPTRPYCEPGLKKTYGMKIASFKQTDTGGPLTVKAIKDGTVDVGLVFTSDPTVVKQGLVVLADDKQLQASDNIVPVVGTSLATGAAASALNAVDAKLDQKTLVSLNTAVGIDRGDPAQVAQQFLQQEGLTS